MQDTPVSLDVVVVDEDADALAAACTLVARAGHRVIARTTGLQEAAGLVEGPAVQLVVIAAHHDADVALVLVQRLADRAACPVVLLLDHDEPDLVASALDRGADAYADRATPGSLRSAIALARRRFAERQGHAAGHGRRAGEGEAAAVERAKGILMERHSIDEPEAYRLLRGEARRRRVRIADVAASVVEARALLDGPHPGPPVERG